MKNQLLFTTFVVSVFMPVLSIAAGCEGKAGEAYEFCFDQLACEDAGGVWDDNACSAPSANTNVDLSVQVQGSGQVSGDGIDCGTDCSESYTQGTEVMLSATPAQGFTFQGWQGACSGSASCIVSMDANTTVTAVFTVSADLPALTGTGTVSSTGEIVSSPNTNFFGGVSIDGINFEKQAESTIAITQPITVKGIIASDPEHVGEKADIFAVGYWVASGFYISGEDYSTSCSYTREEGKHFYQLVNVPHDSTTDDNDWYTPWTEYNRSVKRADFGDWNTEVRNWNGDLPDLQPYKANVVLTDNYPVMILDNTIINAKGRLCISFGYRLNNGDGALIFNEESVDMTLDVPEN